MTWEEQTASLKEFLTSTDREEMIAEFDAWSELQQEADAVIETYGSAKDAFKYAALAGQFELAAVIARKGGMTGGQPQEDVIEIITQAAANNYRYGVHSKESLVGWCSYTFDDE